MREPLEWKAYLQDCSRQIIEAGEADGPILPKETIRSGWLGYEGASSTAVRQAEKRLGISLPPSLSAFYAVTNGWRTVGCFVWNVLPVEKIGWLAELEPDLWENAISLEEHEANDERADIRSWAYEEGMRVKRSLVASAWAECDASTCLLDPETVNDNGEWAGGRWSSWNPGMEWIADSFEGLFRDEYEMYLRLRTND